MMPTNEKSKLLTRTRRNKTQKGNAPGPATSKKRSSNRDCRSSTASDRIRARRATKSVKKESGPTGRTKKTKKGEFSPKSVSLRDRYNVAGLLTCLFRAGQDLDEQILKKMYTRLKLSPVQQRTLLRQHKLSQDHSRFAQAIRGENVRWMVLHDLLVATVSDGCYDAREREGFRRIAALLRIPWERVTAAEDRLAKELRMAPPCPAPLRQETPEAKKKQRWRVIGTAAAAAVAGIALAPFAAPAVGGTIGTYFLGLSGAAATSAGLATLGGGSLAAGGFGMAGGTAAIASALGLSGASLVGRKMARRIGGINEFRYVPLGGEGMHSFIAVSGFLSEESDPTRMWAQLPAIAQHGEHWALRWESQHLLDLGKMLASIGMHRAGSLAIQAFAKHASRAATRNFNWPVAVLNAASLIDNPWSVAKDRSEKTAQLLADNLSARVHGHRPVTLIGFSLGARVIFRALEKLGEKGDRALGVVDHVVLMGGAFSADSQRWRKLRHIAAGRVINAYCPTDWVLGYLYRAAELEFQNIAGLHAVNVPGVESIDVSQFVDGHLSYKEKMEALLSHLAIDSRKFPTV